MPFLGRTSNLRGGPPFPEGVGGVNINKKSRKCLRKVINSYNAGRLRDYRDSKELFGEQLEDNLAGRERLGLPEMAGPGAEFAVA